MRASRGERGGGKRRGIAGGGEGGEGVDAQEEEGERGIPSTKEFRSRVPRRSLTLGIEQHSNFVSQELPLVSNDCKLQWVTSLFARISAPSICQTKGIVLDRTISS